RSSCPLYNGVDLRAVCRSAQRGFLHSPCLGRIVHGYFGISLHGPERGLVMANLTMRRIHFAAADAASELDRLQKQLSLQADVVSPRGRELTEQVFGMPLTPAQVVERICGDVKQRGLDALLHYTEKLDHARLTAETLRVSSAELKEAHAGADP